MKKTLVLLGASIIMLGALNGGAEARKVTYEINGKRYSYSTNNLAQTAAAKRRIEAARAAEAAKAKADTEKAQNPLTAAFGSSTQREAKEAQEKLQQLLSERSEDTATLQPTVQSSRERRAGRRGKRQDLVREAFTAGTLPKSAPSMRAPTKATTVTAAPAVAEPLDIRHRIKVRSVSFDVETGIKTTIMIDGTVVEEPFDSSVLSALVHGDEDKSSLMAFVNQLRKTAPEEATGSVRTRVAEPEPERANWHH